MRTFGILFLALFLFVGLMPGFAAPPAEDDKEDSADLSAPTGGKGGKDKVVTAETVIARIKAHKDKIIARIKERLEKLPERLQKIQEKANKRMGGKGKGRKGLASGTETPRDPATIKQRVEERYNQFKERISKRQETFAKRTAKRKEMITKRIAKLPAADQAKVMAEFEAAEKDIVAQVEKASVEAAKKLEETYKAILSSIEGAK